MHSCSSLSVLSPSACPQYVSLLLLALPLALSLLLAPAQRGRGSASRGRGRGGSSTRIVRFPSPTQTTLTQIGYKRLTQMGYKRHKKS